MQHNLSLAKKWLKKWQKMVKKKKKTSPTEVVFPFPRSIYPILGRLYQFCNFEWK